MEEDMRKNMYAIEQLFTLLDQFGSYPNGVMKIPGRFDGTAFFPGGWGLWNTHPHELLPPVPIGGSMVLGHNFDSEAGFQHAFSHAGENLKSATWRNLLAFLKQVGISPEQCFFTNAYVGLRAGDHAMGAFSGARDPEFVRWCRNFLLKRPGSSNHFAHLHVGCLRAWVPSSPFPRITERVVRCEAASHARRARSGAGVSEYLFGGAAPCCGRGAHPSRLPQVERQISSPWEHARG